MDRESTMSHSKAVPDNGWWCRHCGWDYDNPIDLERHLIGYHRGDRQFGICGMLFETFDERLEHLKEHVENWKKHTPNWKEYDED